MSKYRDPTAALGSETRGETKTQKTCSPGGGLRLGAVQGHRRGAACSVGTGQPCHTDTYKVIQGFNSVVDQAPNMHSSR